MNTDNDSLKQKLTEEEYKVLREGGTEAPFSGKYVDTTDKGMYVCKVCGQKLFSSEAKFESKAVGLQGWPSFSDPVNLEHIELRPDDSLGSHRTEVLCKNCGSHLGHVFEDVPGEDGKKHYCINSVCLDLQAGDNSVDK